MHSQNPPNMVLALQCMRKRERSGVAYLPRWSRYRMQPMRKGEEAGAEQVQPDEGAARGQVAEVVAQASHAARHDDLHSMFHIRSLQSGMHWPD